MRLDPSSLLGVNSEPSNQTGTPASDSRSEAPRELAHFDAMPKPLVLPDGTWAAYFLNHEGPGLSATPARQAFYARFSNDRGATWSEPQTLVDLPAEAGGFGYFVPLLDKHGEVHFFVLCDAGTGAVRPRGPEAGQASIEPLARQRLDVWHVKSASARTKWEPAKQIWQGRAGDLQSVVQLDNGRIVLPLSYYVDRSWGNRGDGPDAFTYNGQFDVTALYSEDEGASWKQSPSILRTSTPDLASYGAVEPVVVQLGDKRVWMLLRTQQGRFYESSSDDGSTWLPAKPSTIKSSDSPAALARLPDNRILLLWNHCQRHPYAQGSRHVLHGAVSSDDAQTWQGYREVLRDPHRDEPPPASGDHGVSYPFVAVSADGEAIFSLWVQSGTGRSLWAFDPYWLTAKHVREDFSKGLDGWSSFGTRGVFISADPDQPETRVLSLQASSGNEWPAAAVWNYPARENGVLRCRIRLEGKISVNVQLTDHFSPPFDEQSSFYSALDFNLVTDAGQSGEIELPKATWADLDIHWNSQTCRGLVFVNRQLQRQLAMRPSAGEVCYLRLAVNREHSLPASRFFLGQVDVDDTDPRRDDLTTRAVVAERTACTESTP